MPHCAGLETGATGLETGATGKAPSPSGGGRGEGLVVSLAFRHG